MTATVEKAWKNSVIKDKEFTVNGYFDLNDENEILVRATNIIHYNLKVIVKFSKG